MISLEWKQGIMGTRVGLYSGLPVIVLTPTGNTWKAEAVMPGCQSYICNNVNIEQAMFQAEHHIEQWINYPRFQTQDSVSVSRPTESLVG